MNPLVSIVIPAYNASKFIEETIESVKRQKYQNWELIVVNDGSKDNTEDIVSKYVLNDSRIRLINTKNNGVSQARNRGIFETSGQYVAFLDADDVWLPENLLVKIQKLEERAAWPN